MKHKNHLLLMLGSFTLLFLLAEVRDTSFFIVLLTFVCLAMMLTMTFVMSVHNHNNHK